MVKATIVKANMLKCDESNLFFLGQFALELKLREGR